MSHKGQGCLSLGREGKCSFLFPLKEAQCFNSKLEGYLVSRPKERESQMWDST